MTDVLRRRSKLAWRLVVFSAIAPRARWPKIRWPVCSSTGDGYDVVNVFPRGAAHPAATSIKRYAGQHLFFSCISRRPAFFDSPPLCPESHPHAVGLAVAIIVRSFLGLDRLSICRVPLALSVFDIVWVFLAVGANGCFNRVLVALIVAGSPCAFLLHPRTVDLPALPPSGILARLVPGIVRPPIAVIRATAFQARRVIALCRTAAAGLEVSSNVLVMGAAPPARFAGV